MEDFEKLGAFYLGREYDLGSKALGGLLLYDSKDLVTHGVCVGMTGSGKTGLCIGLLEEAAIDGIPSLVIDPKGDLADLLLTFPDLRSEDFRPWINEEEAGNKGLSPEDFAQQQAEQWTKGLADWGQDASRIRRLREAADFTIYTPGSTAGLPVSILKSFAAPAQALRDDPETLRDRINTVATSVLGLVGVTADPIQSREHILLSSLLDSYWSAGRDLDLPTLIQQIQTPPFAKVGVLDLEAFYPQKERFGLALLLNNLLASPTFQTWLEGEALDVGRMLFTAEGRPRVSIFSIAHLSDSERMFFVSLLLNEVVGWMRTQPGTGSLRAIVYMDEIFGYFPPVAEPPSKLPLLTLLKQARAYGVGVLLATQNPVDLDYKGLANAGTWFIGRLQTERDKARLLEGLEGVAAGSETGFDRQKMEETLAGLGKRVFLMHNTHEDAPAVFQTRWTLSYLSGPLTRTQIKTLMDPKRPPETPVGPAAAAAPTATPAAAAVAATTLADTAAAAAVTSPEAATSPTAPSALPAEVPQFFLPLRGAVPADGQIVYRPGVLATATVNFVSAKTGAGTSTKVLRVAPLPEGTLALDWEGALPLDMAVEDIERQPYPGVTFAPVPAAMEKVSSYRSWSSDFSAWAFRTQTVEVFKSPGFKLTSDPGETEGEFRTRLQLVAREKRDDEAEKLRKKYGAKTASLQQRVQRAEHSVEREAEQAQGRKVQTAISLGATLLSAFTGRKITSSGTLGRATTTMRDVGRSLDEGGDVKRAEESLAAHKQALADLETEFQSEVDALGVDLDPMTEELEHIQMRPRKSDIAVDLVGLLWMPYRQDSAGALTNAWE